MRFSELTVEFPGARNRLYQRLDEVRGDGADVIDLVRAGPHEAGIEFPPEILGEALTRATREARVYAPNSFGQLSAREAIAGYEGVTPDSILITAGTSLSYWYVFKLLAEPGDEILCPVPSYPLFEYIARLAGVEITGYPLEESKTWAIDLDQLDRAITARTRGIVVISPHNPTGMVLASEQCAALASIARRRGLPLIVDEVFREFVFDGAATRTSDTEAPLVFTLNGLSKMFALPGMKVGWMAVTGDASLVRKSMATLELISDTFLPVNEIAQFATPAIFSGGREFLAEYRRCVRACRDRALDALGDAAAAPPQGGFYMTLPYVRDIDEEDLAIELLEEERLLVHPGYFYDTPSRHLVFSFLAAPDRLTDALSRVRKHLLPRPSHLF